MLVLGLIAIVGPIAVYIYQRQVYEQDVQAVNRLGEELDSTGAALAGATTPADSARLADDIRAREYWLGRHQYHVPRRQTELERWWRPTGPGTLTVAVGLVLVAISVALLRRHKRGAT